jgi:hypothetical protein
MPLSLLYIQKHRYLLIYSNWRVLTPCSNNVSPVTSSLRPHVLDIPVPLSQGSSSQHAHLCACPGAARLAAALCERTRGGASGLAACRLLALRRYPAAGPRPSSSP